MDNIDRYGHCVTCHKSMMVERAVDGKVIPMFTPDYAETEFLLVDGSKMRVAICKPCKEHVDLASDKVKGYVMEAVINGWQLEVDSLVKDEKRPEWDVDRGKKHMARYSALKIECPSEGLEQHVITDKVKKLREVLNGSD